MDTATQTRSDTISLGWDELNRRWLLAALAALRARIATGPTVVADRRDCIEATPHAGFRPALVGIADAFELSPFERELLLLLVGLELDDGLREAFAEQSGDASARPSFGAALGLLVSPHWDALSPDAPLRHWRMLGVEPSGPLMLAPLRLDERVLHWITGMSATDPVLAGYVTRLEGDAGQVEEMGLVRRIAAALGEGSIVQIEGGSAPARRDWILAANAACSRSTLWIDAADLPSDPPALHTLARHIGREAALASAVSVIEASVIASRTAFALAERIASGLVWLGPMGQGADVAIGSRRILRFSLPTDDPARIGSRLVAHWRTRAAPSEPVEAALERAARYFRPDRGAMEGLIETVLASEPPARADAVWPAAKAAARGGLDDIAQRIPTRAVFDDIVLPPGQGAMLRDIARQLRQRDRVYTEWGFGERYQGGQGLVALFSGESGTGKTLAAEAIAHEAGLDLYRIDLATLVSKYIGETEKNLKRLFDAADASGAVLLFDEADALFGKRSEVKDSHDRYANIEVAYLLQRVEASRGLAILTTNRKSALDRAFLRRIRFVVNFPLPDAVAREAIWRRQIPDAAPRGEIDFKALAKLNICGGNIRSIAVSAAFKAADAGRVIDQSLLIAAAHEEFAKLERSMAGGAP